jgi:hypothetical protein
MDILLIAGIIILAGVLLYIGWSIGRWLLNELLFMIIVLWAVGILPALLLLALIVAAIYTITQF